MRVSIVATALDTQGLQTKPVVSMVHRIHTRNVGYSDDYINSSKINQATLNATEGATALDMNRSINQNQVVEKHEQINGTSLENISIENATFLENMENKHESNEVNKLDNEMLNFEVDSIELATPQPFSNDKKIDNVNEEKEIKLFDNSDNKDNSEIEEPEMFEKMDSEENFEIPAFLRRQKN